MKICRSKDVPWRVNAEEWWVKLYSVFCFGSESWCWSRIVTGQDWRVGDESIEVALQDENMEDETVKVYCTRTARTVRSIWKTDEASPSEQNYC